jgi:arylsulfatase A-like enzyme
MGSEDNTIVVIASDHGDMMGRHQLVDKGPFSYDDIYRVPLAVAGPGVHTGSCNEFVYLHDLFATLLELAGVDVPVCDAASLTPLLTDDQGWSSRDEVFGEFDYQICASTQRVIRTRTHKFVFNASDTCELYDLQHDPDEMHNRVNDPVLAATKQDLKARLLARLRVTDDSRAAFHLEAVTWAL